MKGFWLMLKKEFKEFLRTYKLYVIPGLFLLLGFTSPILTKLTPQLLGSLFSDIGLELPTMTWLDSYAQFFKNLSQLGLLAVVLTTMGTIAEERNRGVAQLVLTKPVSRGGYVIAKYVASLLVVSLATLLAFGATWFYTDILFTDTVLSAGATATAIYLIYMAVILALTVLASALTKSVAAAGGLTVCGFIALKILPLFSPLLAKYSPEAMLGWLDVASKGEPLSAAFWIAAAVTVGVVGVILGAAVWTFSRVEL